MHADRSEWRGRLRVLAVLVWSGAVAAAEVPKLDLEPGFSVSGLSSGAAMAVQLGVAYSAQVKGVGIVAGPPYLCAQGLVTRATNTCLLIGREKVRALFGEWLAPAEKDIEVDDLVEDTRRMARRGRIDPVSGIADMRVWEYRGEADRVVGGKASAAQRQYFTTLGARFERGVPPAQPDTTPHTMPTDDADQGSCDTQDKDYVSGCGFDAAGSLLRYLRKAPAATAEASPDGRWYVLAQGDYIPDLGRVSGSREKRRMLGLATAARVFVPAVCEQARCAVHVALHGCLQGTAKPYRAWVEHAGYTHWAGPLHLVLVFPRVEAIEPYARGAWDSIGNPQGCWDWWGYTTPTDLHGYAVKGAPQMQTIVNMVDALRR